jgi:hypothetical protein
MLEDWARAAGFAAIALDYPKYYAEWTCKAQRKADQPNNSSSEWVVCRPSQANELHPESDDAKQHSQSQASEVTKTTDRLLALFTGLLVAVGAFQAYYLWGTVQATRDAAHAAKFSADHIPRVERAYIYGGTNYFRSASNELKLMVKINNFGKTPAFIGTVAATICSDEELSKPIVWQEIGWKGWVLPAPTPDIPTDVILPFIRYGDVIIGRIWYRDIFNDCHSSGFVLRLNADGLPAVGGQKHWEDRPEPNLGPAEAKSA